MVHSFKLNFHSILEALAVMMMMMTCAAASRVEAIETADPCMLVAIMWTCLDVHIGGSETVRHMLVAVLLTVMENGSRRKVRTASK